MADLPEQPARVPQLFQLVLVWLLIIPSILCALFREIFPSPGKSLKRKVALVTGGGQGLGRGLALGLAKEGCKVAIVDLDKESALQTAEELRQQGYSAQAYATDVSEVVQVKKLHSSVTKDLGPVDILVNNAGIVHADLLDTVAEDTIRRMIDVNFTSHYWMVREFLPDMKKRDSGHIVAIGSVTALLPGVGGSVYSATKAGVKVMMEVLRAELRASSSNIQTTSVFPFFINTRHIHKYDVPLFRVLTIEEVVEATIDAIKKDKAILSIPRSHYMQAYFLAMLPQYIIDKATSLFGSTFRRTPSPR